MTRDDIIRMAREAGLLPLLDEDCFQAMGSKNFDATKKVLERFAALVAAAEREKILEICKEGLWDAGGIRNHLEQQDAAIRNRGKE